MEQYQTLGQNNPTVATHSLIIATFSWVLPLMGLFLIPIFYDVVVNDYHILETIYPYHLIYLYAGLTLAGPFFTLVAWIQCKRLGRQFLPHAITGTIVNILTLLVFSYLAFILFLLMALADS